LQDEPKKPDKDILAEKQENIAVINYYFDTTPLNLFNGIITEKGFFQPVDIKEYIQKQSLHPFLKRNDS
jgi:methylthioribose-1-phosphate isomerase